jgi:rhodanese-related sulfurtransferase
MNDQIEFYMNKLEFEIDSSDLFSAMENGESVVPLDTRQAFGFNKEHIPNAINIPHREMNTDSTKLLDKAKTYICYCDGIGCNASTKGALNMTKLGFKVKELIGGIEWWKFDGYATEGTENSGGVSVKCAC